MSRRGKSSPARERSPAASSTPQPSVTSSLPPPPVPSAPAAAFSSTLDPHDVANVLLQLGTTPFAVALLALAAGPISTPTDVTVVGGYRFDAAASIGARTRIVQTADRPDLPSLVIAD